MYNLFFLLLLISLTSCNNRVVRFKISGQTQNMKYANNAYLYIEKDSLLQNCYIYTGNESKKKFDLYKCPLISNSFHFKGKVLRSNTNPIAVAYLFLDTLDDFSNQELMRRIRSDHNSKAAHINSWLSWSDVGFLYFLTSTLIALVGEYNIIKSLALINLIAVFYSIYSIYYQAVIAQQWCLLCCIVQATVVLSAFIAFHWINDLNFTYSTIALLLILSIVSISIMKILIKPLLKNFYEHSRFLLAYEKLKANSTVIKALFSEQKIIDSTLNVTSLDLGNSNATNEIIIVTNLFCEPCALLHEKVEKWLKTYKELSIKLIFISYARNDKKRIRVIQSLFALDQSTKEMALSEWFKNGKHHPDKWLEKYGLIEITPYYSDLILQQQHWCQQMKIESTPTLFINDKQMPRIYTFDDVPLLTLAIS